MCEIVDHRFDVRRDDVILLFLPLRLIMKSQELTLHRFPSGEQRQQIVRVLRTFDRFSKLVHFFKTLKQITCT